MNNLAKAVLVIALLAIVFGLIYLQLEIENLTPKSNGLVDTPTPILSPTPPPILSPTPPPNPPLTPAKVTSNISITPIRNFNDTSFPEGDYLLINGSVTNNSTNTAYNVGLKVFDVALVLAHYTTVIDVTVPIKSGLYNTGENYVLSTISANQTVPISIMINPDYQSQEPDLQNYNVTLVWSNAS
jgi:hypothetical protein